MHEQVSKPATQRPKRLRKSGRRPAAPHPPHQGSAGKKRGAVGPRRCSARRALPVIAPDLLGHGESAKPRGDYSLGAYACGRARPADRRSATSARPSSATRSAAGSRCSSPTSSPSAASGSCSSPAAASGRRSTPVLRAATLPGSELVLPLIATRLLGSGRSCRAALGRIGLRTGPDLAEMARGYASLANAEGRRAFVHTVRAVIDPTASASTPDRPVPAAEDARR